MINIPPPFRPNNYVNLNLKNLKEKNPSDLFDSISITNNKPNKSSGLFD